MKSTRPDEPRLRKLPIGISMTTSSSGGPACRASRSGGCCCLRCMEQSVGCESARESNPVQRAVITALPESIASLNMPRCKGLARIKAGVPVSGTGPQPRRTLTGATAAALCRVRSRLRPVDSADCRRTQAWFFKAGRQRPEHGCRRTKCGGCTKPRNFRCFGQPNTTFPT